ncbi:MAG: A/G-specific adenine glycosylase [Promethearchaeota archaeon]|nr:MAG: A/G-specific adenine glycosylase [Candidatus Lokiarchaeota archaeon]
MVKRIYPSSQSLNMWEIYVQTSEFKALAHQISQRLILWFNKNGRDLPWRKTHNPYHILVSELMLQQTQVDRVIEYYQQFLNALPNFEAVAQAPESLLLKLWEGLGYYNRVRNLQKTARIILEKYNGTFPTQKEEILSLPGIGEYTAGAVMTFALNLREPIVDTNVNRILHRIFLYPTKNSENSTFTKILWLLSENLLPEENYWEFNQGIMDFGAIHCTGTKPHCFSCYLKEFCQYYQSLSLTRFFK